MEKELRIIRDAGAVKRYHTTKLIQNDTVAQHSWNVAMIIVNNFPECRIELLKAALSHDVGEYFTGDLPAPVKWQYTELNSIVTNIEQEKLTELYLSFDLSKQESYILQFADTFEFLCFCLDEHNLGNKKAQVLFNSGYSYLQQFLCKEDMTKVIFSETLKTMHNLLVSIKEQFYSKDFLCQN